MVMKDWVLPILLGIVAAIALMSILYNNPRVKQAFADIGALMQLNADKPYVIPVVYDKQLDMNMNMNMNNESSYDSNIYNYYPKTPGF